MAWEIKLQILYSLFVGSFLTACFSALLEFCFKPGNIFGFWKIWLAKGIVKRHHLFNEDTSGLSKKPKQPDRHIRIAAYDAMIKVASGYANWEKPLGMCAYCMNVWICFATFFLTELPHIVSVNWWFVWLFIAYPALSNYFLSRMQLE